MGLIGRLKKFSQFGKYEKKFNIRKRLNMSISSSLLTYYLREKGVRIGGGTIFHDANNTTVATQRPWMISIGKYCKITGGVVILDHDYSRSVLRMRYGDILGECRKTEIGDNVFIGLNSIILMGTHIGNNVIVGAGSVVSGTFPDDVVIAGNPAKIICTLEELYEKRKKRYVEEGKLYAREFYLRYNRIPTVKEMGPFFPLFLERSKEALAKNNVWTKWNGDDEASIIESFMNSKPQFANYKVFLKSVLSEVIEDKELSIELQNLPD
mgnify:CR=1 FL=1